MCDWVSVALRTCVACLRDLRIVLRVEVWLGGSVEVWLGLSSAKQSNGGRGGRREEDKGRQRQKNKKVGEGGETWIAVNLAEMQQEGDQLTSLTDWVVDIRSAQTDHIFQASAFPPLAKGTSWSGGPDELRALYEFCGAFCSNYSFHPSQIRVWSIWIARSPSNSYLQKLFWRLPSAWVRFKVLSRAEQINPSGGKH